MVKTSDFEITPAMIAAGMEEYVSVWTDLRDVKEGAAEAMLVRAYLAMASATGLPDDR